MTSDEEKFEKAIAAHIGEIRATFMSGHRRAAFVKVHSRDPDWFVDKPLPHVDEKKLYDEFRQIVIKTLDRLDSENVTVESFPVTKKPEYPAIDLNAIIAEERVKGALCGLRKDELGRHIVRRPQDGCEIADLFDGLTKLGSVQVFPNGSCIWWTPSESKVPEKRKPVATFREALEGLIAQLENNNGP